MGRALPALAETPAGAQPLTHAGTYVGTGSLFDIPLPFKPSWGFVTGEGAEEPLFLSEAAFVGRSPRWGSGASLYRAAIPIPNGLRLDTNANVNEPGRRYHFFVMAENMSGQFMEADHAGNNVNGRILRYFEGKPQQAVIFKRDSSPRAILALPGHDAVYQDGTAAPSIVLNADGTITVANDPGINYWGGSGVEPPSVGESCAAFAWPRDSEWVKTRVYRGTGEAQSIDTGLGDLEAFIIWPLGSDGAVPTPSAWVNNGDLGASLLSMTSLGSRDDSADNAVAVADGVIGIGPGGRANSPGTNYALIAFRQNRDGTVWRNELELRPDPLAAVAVVTEAGHAINCGTSDTLKFDGAITLEWMGTHGVRSGSYPKSDWNDSDTIAPLMWRSGGADATEGAVSFGMAITRNPNSSAYPAITISVCPYFNMRNAGGLDLDQFPVWHTGVPVRTDELAHIVATHDGSGFWRVYKNGVLLKERDYDMTQATPSRPNIAGGAGHRMFFGGRGKAIDGDIHAPEVVRSFRVGRLYGRALTPDEVSLNYRSCFASGPAATPGFVEEWFPEGGNLVATNHPENSGLNGLYIPPA